jgi:O-methyltransferase involved in polyketide biosynthesis
MSMLIVNSPEKMGPTQTKERNFNTISPSAKSLLLMKGYTDIPFARRAAELLSFPHEYIPDFEKKDMTFWARTVHFENRYRSIDNLLAGIPVTNVLELSSGYSFRGLEYAKKPGIYYIDTDLPEVISRKKKLIEKLRDEGVLTEGKLELRALNCLDEPAFTEITDCFPDGEIVIINEGLLMYLDMQEKERLCTIIRKNLLQRGGYWITADIYLKTKQMSDLKIDDTTKEFFLLHKLEENKFNSFDEARDFFRRMGFLIDKEAEVKRSELSSMKYFIKSLTLKQLSKFRKTGKINTTWRLKVAG